jgi:hydrogenase-4 component F
MTTLSSAFLVGFYNTGESVEAAWKYIIICSVGIAIALFGTILFYYALSGSGTNSLNWTDMAMAAKKLDPRVLKIAFLFILVGYGTKAGVAPMHTWLPDAHSQALTPISALLSAVLLKTALYAILRFAIIVNKCAGEQYCGNLFIFFGLLSLGISAGFVILQKDIKRLLAYSSIEHIGVVLVGFGISGVLGIYGALMHVFNHAAAKSLMFFCAGNILKNYKTTNMNVIRGLGKVLPFTGVVAILGAFALSGSPPFSLFISEIMILAAAFSKGSYIVCALFIIFLSVAFAAIVYNLSRVVFGKKPEGMVVEGEALSTKLAFVFLFVLICVLGVKIPAFFNDILTAAGKVVSGA